MVLLSTVWRSSCRCCVISVGDGSGSLGDISGLTVEVLRQAVERLYWVVFTVFPRLMALNEVE